MMNTTHSESGAHSSPPPPPPNLERSLASWRSFSSSTLTLLCTLATLLAVTPMFSVIYMLITHGLKRMSLAVFTTRIPPLGEGFGPAIVGTAIVVGLATLLSVPFGILVGLYLSEFGEKGRGSSAIRFGAKVLSGLPSIIAGVVAYSLIVLTRESKQFSAVAGAVALAILMLPTIILTAEEAFKQVPRKMREAAYGMGCTDTQVAVKIVLPTAIPGVLTGVMLSVARACGETAPLLFTAFFTLQWYDGNLMKPISSLAVFIYNFSGRPSPNDVELAWTASLVLVFFVLILNISAQWITRSSMSKQR